jgi:hypothetical protein
MQAYRLETKVSQNSTLILHSLPFHTGEVVEVIILSKPSESSTREQYSLRGKAIVYLNPTEPVAQTDWESGA